MNHCFQHIHVPLMVNIVKSLLFPQNSYQILLVKKMHSSLHLSFSSEPKFHGTSFYSHNRISSAKINPNTLKSFVNKSALLYVSVTHPRGLQTKSHFYVQSKKTGQRAGWRLRSQCTTQIVGSALEALTYTRNSLDALIKSVSMSILKTHQPSDSKIHNFHVFLLKIFCLSREM